MNIDDCLRREKSMNSYTCEGCQEAFKTDVSGDVYCPACGHPLCFKNDLPIEPIEEEVSSDTVESECSNECKCHCKKEETGVKKAENGKIIKFG